MLYQSEGIKPFKLTSDQQLEISKWLDGHFCTARKQDYWVDLRVDKNGLSKYAVCPCGVAHPLDK